MTLGKLAASPTARVRSISAWRCIRSVAATLRAAGSLDEVSFNELKELLAITDGNLASHLKALEENVFVKVDKGFIGRNWQGACVSSRAAERARDLTGGRRSRKMPRYSSAEWTVPLASARDELAYHQGLAGDLASAGETEAAVPGALRGGAAGLSLRNI